MHDNLTNEKIKTAIITGGNRGIGLAIVKAYAQAGYHVVVGARTRSEALEDISGHISIVDFDARHESGHQALVDKALEVTGRVDVYVNNAGYSAWRPIEDIEDEFLSDLMATNIKGVFWGCKVAAKVLSSSGSIINISSLAGKRGSKNNSAYCATKFAVNGMTQSLAKELGEKGIRVNAVCPVLVTTQGLIDALAGEHSPAAGEPEQFLQNFSTTQPALQRLPMADEVSSTCLFLSSNNASAITGQCINVDCGVLPQ